MTNLGFVLGICWYRQKKSSIHASKNAFFSRNRFLVMELLRHTIQKPVQLSISIARFYWNFEQEQKSMKQILFALLTFCQNSIFFLSIRLIFWKIMFIFFAAKKDTILDTCLEDFNYRFHEQNESTKFLATYLWPVDNKAGQQLK